LLEAVKKKELTYCNKMKSKNITLLEQFQILLEKSYREAESISLTHDRSFSRLGTGTSIKSGGVKLVLWAQIKRPHIMK